MYHIYPYIGYRQILIVLYHLLKVYGVFKTDTPMIVCKLLVLKRGMVDRF